MSLPRIAFYIHAIDMLDERLISIDWVSRTLWSPDEVEPDPDRPERQRAFKAIEERDNRVLRVVFETCGGNYQVVTVFFDRGRKR